MSERINWYPGHMAKTKRQLAESLKLVDVIVEMIDARAPLATRNPDFDELFAGKKRVLLMNKSDLANKADNSRWIEHYRQEDITAIEFVAVGGSGRKKAVEAIERAASEKLERLRARGITGTVRAIIAGIPNVGKSTFINSIAGAGRTETGDRPGVTRSNRWIRITPYLELMDTPGLLWPKLEDPERAKHLAFTGSIKDDIMDVERLAMDLLCELITLAPDALIERYKQCAPGMDDVELITAVCKSRGFIVSKGECDYERAARVVLDEFRAGKLGRVTLERP